MGLIDIDVIGPGFGRMYDQLQACIENVQLWSGTALFQNI